MKPVAFDYIRADSTEEVVDLLSEYGDDARVLAGGQSLMAALNMRLTQPRVLVDISRIAELSRIRVSGSELTVGAAVTQSVVEATIQGQNHVPLLAQAFPHLGHFQTRNRGTVCGSVAHADPSAELPLCLATLAGTVTLRSRKRRRNVTAKDFFQGVLTTAREADEVVESVQFPLAKKGARYGFQEVSMRHGDFAIVALAVSVSSRSVQLGIGGVADRPWVEDIPVQSGTDLDGAIEDLVWKLGAQDDQHASARYRRHLVRTLGRKLIAGLSGNK